METFPWTRVDGVELPREHKAPVDLPDREEVSLQRSREIMGDGSFGGWYERPAEEMEEIWSVAIEETRDKLESGWSG